MINNFDLRWELYQPGGQMFAVSGFYKSFTNPIELVAFSEQSPNSITPRNVGDATVAEELIFIKNIKKLQQVKGHLKERYRTKVLPTSLPLYNIRNLLHPNLLS